VALESFSLAAAPAKERHTAILANMVSPSDFARLAVTVNFETLDFAGLYF
jgi:hypothetical protein